MMSLNQVEKLNLIGAITSITLMLLCCLVFVFRLVQQKEAEYWTGICFLLAGLPLIYLLVKACGGDRPPLYFVQLSLMIGFILIELLLDYIFKIDFRHVAWMTISYVVIFFASTGGMVGVASMAGRIWMYVSIVIFLGMAFLAIYQRIKTGL